MYLISVICSVGKDGDLTYVCMWVYIYVCNVTNVLLWSKILHIERAQTCCAIVESSPYTARRIIVNLSFYNIFTAAL